MTHERFWPRFLSYMTLTALMIPLAVFGARVIFDGGRVNFIIVVTAAWVSGLLMGYWWKGAGE